MYLLPINQATEINTLKYYKKKHVEFAREEIKINPNMVHRSINVFIETARKALRSSETTVATCAQPVSRFQELCYNLAGFNKYGLMRDDLLHDDDPAVAEALKRLDPDEYDCRVYRILRATQLSIKNEYLPKCEWTKLEEDELYLTPIIKEIEREKMEEWIWNSKY